MKPLPVPSPSRWSAGTRTLSKNSSDVSCAFMPIFLRLPALKPGAALDEHQEVPLAPAWGWSWRPRSQVGVLAVGDEGLAAVDHQ